MALTRYWVGGGGTWDSSTTTRWSASSGGAGGASAPTSADNVIVDLNSGLVNGAVITVAASAVCHDLTVTGPAVKSFSIVLNGPFAPTGAVSLNGNSAVNRILVGSTTIGAVRVLTVGSMSSLMNVDFRDITAAGAASPFHGTSIGDCQGNSGVTFDAPTTQTWQTTGSGNWSDVTKWTSRVPLPQDDVVINKAFVGSVTLTVDMPRAGRNIDWTGSTKGTSLGWNAVTTPTTIFGDLTFASGMVNASGSATLTLAGRGAQKLRSNGTSIAQALAIAGPGGTYTLQDTLLVGTIGNRSLAVQYGTLDTNNQTITALSLVLSTSLADRNVTCGDSDIFLTGTGNVLFVSLPAGTTTTWDAGTSTITLTDTSATVKNISIATGAAVFNNITAPGGGALAITGDLVLNTLTLGSGKTVTVFPGKTLALNDLVTQGPVTWVSNTPGSFWNIRKTSGTLIVASQTFTDSHAIGGAAFFAGATSVDVSGNSGWVFGDPPPLVLRSSDNSDTTVQVSEGREGVGAVDD